MKLNTKYIFTYLLYLQRVQPSFLVCQETRNDHSQAADYQKHRRHQMSGLWHQSQSDAPLKKLDKVVKQTLWTDTKSTWLETDESDVHVFTLCYEKR